MSRNQGYPHEYNALMVLLRNFIIRLMDRYGLKYNEDNQAFTKHNKAGDVIFKVYLSDILKGI